MAIPDSVQEKRAARNEAQREEAPRERQEGFGGPRLKLSVIGSIPGYHLYFENDDEGAIEQLLYEGFEFVKPDEVKMMQHIVADADITDRVSRYVGKKADGSPMRAYLLKIREDLWEERERNRYRQADEWESAIKKGYQNPEPGRYIPAGVTNNIDNQYRKEY